MNTRKLEQEVYDNLNTGFEELPIDLLERIRDYGEEEFVINLSANFPYSFVQNFLVAHLEVWRSFTDDTWRQILMGLQDNELGLYTLISFLSKFEILDALDLYKSIPGINEEVRVSVIRYFSERSALLKLHKYELKNLLAHNVIWVNVNPEDDDVIEIM